MKAQGSSRVLAVLCCFIGGSAIGFCQAQEKPADYSQDCAYFNAFGGFSAADGPSLRAAGNAGITGGQYFASPFGKKIVPAPQFELGAIGPLSTRRPVDGLVSFNLMLANEIPHKEVYPFVVGGLTRMFLTGNAVNYGIGFDVGRNHANKSVRFEIRDYYLFSGLPQHVVGFRIAFGNFIAD
jgi:hypothetical protein